MKKHPPLFLKANSFIIATHFSIHSHGVKFSSYSWRRFWFGVISYFENKPLWTLKIEPKNGQSLTAVIELKIDKNYSGDSILIIAVAYFLQVHFWKDVHWVPTWDAGNQMFSILQLDALFPPLTVIGHCAGDLLGVLLKQLESAAACLSPPKVFTHTGRGFKAIKWECRKQTQPNLSIFSIFLVLYLRTCSLIWFLYQKETIDNMGTFLICWHLWVTVHWQLSFYPFT